MSSAEIESTLGSASADEEGELWLLDSDGNVVYDTVEDGKYMSALQVERLNNRQLCTELEQVDVNNGKVLDTESQYCMN